MSKFKLLVLAFAACLASSNATASSGNTGYVNVSNASGTLPVSHGGTGITTTSTKSLIASNTAGVIASFPFTASGGVEAAWGTGLTIDAAIPPNVITASGTYYLSASDNGIPIIFNACANASIVLPSAASVNSGFKTYIHTGMSGCAVSWTIDAYTNSQTLNGNGSKNMTLVYGMGGWLESDGTEWWYKGPSLTPLIAYGATFFTVTSGCGTPTGQEGFPNVGGVISGKFVSNSSSCSPVLTFTQQAPTGWNCMMKDLTAPAATFTQTAASSTTCSMTGTTTSGDTVLFVAYPY